MKYGASVYVYTLSSDGHVVERVGTVNKRTDDSLIVTVSGRQHIILSRRSGEIKNNSMWSKTPQKNVYIEKMLDILTARQAECRDKLAAVTRKIANIREG